MKSSIKPAILFSLIIVSVIAFLVLAYVGIIIQNDYMVKEKIIKEENIVSVKNQKVILMAQFQNLTSSERIIPIAVNELGMVKQSGSPSALVVEREDIIRIQSIISSKYE